MINWKIDLGEIINITLLLIGGALGYYLIDRIQQEDSRFEVIETLADNLKNISPGLDVHYTNQISRDGKDIEFKAYIKNVSGHDVYIGSPFLHFHLADKKIHPVDLKDVAGFNNMLAPEIDLCLNFKVSLVKNAELASIVFQADTIDAYRNALLLAVEQLSEAEVKDDIVKSIKDHTSKKYSYRESFYAHGKNKVWDNFCMLRDKSGVRLNLN